MTASRSESLYLLSSILHIVCVEIITLLNSSNELMYELIKDYFGLPVLSVKDVNS